MFGFKLISAASVLIPLIAGIICFKHLGHYMRSFFWFIVFSTVFEGLNDYIGIVYQDNMWMFKIFLICDFVFFVWFYHIVFEKPLWDIRISIFPFVLIFISEFIAERNHELNQYVSWFHLVVFLFFIVQSFYAIIKSFEYFESNIFRFPVFWISFARLFYFIIIVFVFVYPKLVYIGENNNLIGNVNGFIASFANICLNVLYAAAFICLKKKV